MTAIQFSKNSFLFRKLDLKSSLVRFSIVWSLASFLLLYIYSYFFVTQEILSVINLNYSLNIAALSFCAWLIGREYHENDGLTAVLSQVITTIVLLLVDPLIRIDILTPLYVFFLARISIEGDSWLKGKVEIFSLLVLIVITTYLTLTFNSWIYLFTLSIAFFVNLTSEEESVFTWIMGLISLLMSIVWVMWKGSRRYVIYIEPLYQYILMTFFLLGIYWGFKGGDVTEIKGRLSRILIAVYAVFVVIFGFTDSIISVIPIISVVLLYVPVRYFNSQDH